MTKRDHKFREQWWRQIENDPEVTEDLLAAAYAISAAGRRDGTRALMSYRRLAEILKRSEATAKRRILKLRELGYLVLVERGGHRGDGTVAANVYELCLPDTDDSQWRMKGSSWDESQPVTHVTHRDPFSTGHLDDPWSGASTGQTGASTGQNDISTGQNAVSTGHPDDPPLSFPSFNPSPNPSSTRGRSPSEAGGARADAVVNSESETHVGNTAELMNGFEKKQDQKRLEEPRCAVCSIYEHNHDHAMRSASVTEGQRHEFVARKHHEPSSGCRRLMPSTVIREEKPSAVTRSAPTKSRELYPSGVGDEQESQEPPEILIDVTQQAGVWANFARVSHSPYEFTLDFVRLDFALKPPRGIVVSRVSLSPVLVRELIKALNENWDIYTKRSLSEVYDDGSGAADD